MTDPLVDLAEAAGLLIRWRDAALVMRQTSPETLRRVLGAMGLPAESQGEVKESRERLAEGRRRPPALLTLEAGAASRLPLPSGARVARLHLEDGSSLDLESEPAPSGGLLVRLPPTPGYHRIEAGGASLELAAAPARGFAVEDAAPGEKTFGLAAQVYSLRDERSRPFGDFRALAGLARAAGRAGADALAVSPVHALYLADPGRYSPYAPSSRLFLNGLYADPDALGPAFEPLDAGGELIDWSRAGVRRRSTLEALFAGLGPTDGALAEAFDRFRREGGEALENHALYEAIHERFFASEGAKGWPDWPLEWRDPSSPQVAAFAQENAERIGFHAFVQFLAHRSLQAAKAEAHASGMRIGLIADIAVGTDAGGSHAWSRRDEILSGLNVGAPPDLYQPQGQDWGVAAFAPEALRRTGFSPFIATLRAALAWAGGLRIDHVMGLQRLWLVPHGASAAEGAYLRYPFDDLMRLIALEAFRSRAVVVGEDLGTVPEGFRESLADRGVMGMSVLWFEREAERFTPASQWSPTGAAMTSTHDLPTVAGWWSGRDLDWLPPSAPATGDLTAADPALGRAEDRRRLWEAFAVEGAAVGPAPAPEEPQAAVDSALAFVARSPSPLALIPLEDLLGLTEQVNLPNALDRHPNWRRRLPGAVDALLEEDRVARRLAALSRRGSS